MPHTAQRVPDPFDDEFEIIQDDAARFARILWTASPDSARDFAKAEHEKACWEPLPDRADFWCQVLTVVSSLSDSASK